MEAYPRKSINLTYESQQLKERTKQQNEEAMKKKKGEAIVYQPLIPFPQRLKQTKLDDWFAKFLNVFRKLEINIPFAEVLVQTPHYTKFMKDIIMKKRKLDKKRSSKLICKLQCNRLEEENARSGKLHYTLHNWKS